MHKNFLSELARTAPLTPEPEQRVRSNSSRSINYAGLRHGPSRAGAATALAQRAANGPSVALSGPR